MNESEKAMRKIERLEKEMAPLKPQSLSRRSPACMKKKEGTRIRICKKCWADAQGRMYNEGGWRYDHYLRLIAERKNNPCSPEEQKIYSACDEDYERFAAEDGAYHRN